MGHSFLESYINNANIWYTVLESISFINGVKINLLWLIFYGSVLFKTNVSLDCMALCVAFTCFI